MARRYFLAACCVSISCLVSGQPPTYGLLGQKLHLMPAIKGQPDDILWTHDGNKVVEFNGKEEHVYSPYENRVTLDWVSAELNVTDLRHEDSGRYGLEAFVNKELHPFDYTVEVIGKVSKPTISCDMSNGSSEARRAQATLTCSADATHPRSLMKYEWGPSGNVSPGRELTISLEDEHDDKMYSCRVSNPLTVDTATFTAKNCYSDESSSVALVAGLIALFIALFIVCGGIFFCKRKHKACFAKRNGDDVEKTRAATEDKEMDRIDESERLLGRAPTLPSHQMLPNFPQNRNMEPNIPANNHKEDMANNSDTEEGPEKNADTDEESPPASPPGRKLSLGQDQDKVSGNDKGDADAGQLGGAAEKADETNPAGVLDDSEDTPSAPEQPDAVQGLTDELERMSLPTGNWRGAEKNADKVEKTESPPASPPGRKPSLGQDQDKVSGNDKGDSDAAQLGGAAEKEDETNPAGELDDSEDTPSAPEQPESEEKKDENEEAKSPPANVRSPPAVMPRTPLTKNSPVVGTDDTTGEHKEDDNSDQVNGETSQEHVKDSHSPVTESHGSSGETQPPTAPELNSSGTAGKDSDLSREETHTGEDDQVELKKTVSEDKSESGCVSDAEEIETEQNPSSDISKQPQSPTQKETVRTRDSEDTPSDVDSSTAPEQPESEEKKGENEEAKSPPANVRSPPAVMPRTPLTKNSPVVGTDDTTVEHKEDDNSDQVNGETSQENVKDSHSPVTESHGSSEETQPPTAPEQNSSGTAGKDSDLSREEAHTIGDDQVELKKTVSEDESESGRVSDGGEIESKQNLSSDNSKQPQSPTQKETDNANTNTSLNSAHAEPDHELESKTGRDPDESEGQVDGSAAKADKSEDEGKEPGNKSPSGDKEVHSET